MSRLVYQCPGCWAYGLYEEPPDDKFWECDCGEKLSVIDLRLMASWRACFKGETIEAAIAAAEAMPTPDTPASDPGPVVAAYLRDKFGLES